MVGVGKVGLLTGGVCVLGGDVRGYGAIGDESAAGAGSTIGSGATDGGRCTRGAIRAGKIEERLLKVDTNNAERRVRRRRSVVVAKDVPPDVVVVEEFAAELIPVSLGVFDGSDSLALGRA